MRRGSVRRGRYEWGGTEMTRAHLCVLLGISCGRTIRIPVDRYLCRADEQVGDLLAARNAGAADACIYLAIFERLPASRRRHGVIVQVASTLDMDMHASGMHASMHACIGHLSRGVRGGSTQKIGKGGKERG